MCVLEGRGRALIILYARSTVCVQWEESATRDKSSAGRAGGITV